MHLLEQRQFVPGDGEEIFDFFEDPTNLERITPPWMSFHVVRSTDDRVRDGTVIDYRLRWLVFPMRWQSIIREYQRGERFVDEMLRGPYSHWYHLHDFTPVPGGVEMVDRVEYRLPLGPLGRLVHSLFVRRQLEAIFAFRREAVEGIFGPTG